MVSEHLGSGGADLASLPAIVAYYGDAMRRFVATGRVRFLPMSNHEGDGLISSVLNPDHVTRVDVRRRVINAAYLEAKVPSMIKPQYDVDDDVVLMPPNGLSRLRESYDHHVIVGGGKTAIDAILFLLDRGVSADAITWVMTSSPVASPLRPTLSKWRDRPIKAMTACIVTTPNTIAPTRRRTLLRASCSIAVSRRG